jgi:outer membrane protein
MKNLLLVVALLAGLAACQPKTATDAAPKTDAPVSASGESFSIAYVNVDSVMSEYAYAKHLSEKFQSAGKAKESELQQKGARFEKRAIDFQNRVQQHLITSVQAEKLGRELEQERQSLGMLQNQMQQELAFQEREMLLMLNDSLIKVLEDINRDGRYKLILRNTTTLGTVLVASPEVDITAKVIQALNARYQASPDSVKTK